MKNLSQGHLMELQARDKEIKSKIEKLGTSSGIEEEIRSKFTVAKGGESMVVIIDAPTTATATSTPAGFWQKIWHFFVK